MSLQLTEIAVQAIITQIRSNIAAELASVNTARGDDQVNLVPPQEYFFFEISESYRRPAVFVMAEDMDMELLEGANHINARHAINVTAVVEERTEKLATLACWRYQAALFKVLHLNQLAGPSLQSKIIPKVASIAYGPVYSEDTKAESADKMFLKEVSLNLNVDHWEPL